MNAHGTFFRIDHILSHKSALSKYEKIKIVACMFSDHNTVKVEVNHKKNFRNTTNTRRLKKILLKDEWVNYKMKDEIKTYTEANED